jgi:hypothetical protein
MPFHAVQHFFADPAIADVFLDCIVRPSHKIRCNSEPEMFLKAYALVDPPTKFDSAQ